MQGQRYWIVKGTLEPGKLLGTTATEQENRLLQEGSVRITTGDLGTELRWIVNSPCVTSLFKAMQWLPSAKGPYILRFFAVGWFEEVYRTTSAAINRIEQVLARGDRHFTGRVFIRDGENANSIVPDVLRDALNRHAAPQEYSVDCALDENSNTFVVERVGPKSAIGRVWGTFTTSHPCQSVGSYGDPVNATYEDVLRTGKPRYDHVLAALRLPDNELHWVPYQRVVIPRKDARGHPGVTVVSQIARVDIQVL
jgi:hypothetical protein